MDATGDGKDGDGRCTRTMLSEQQKKTSGASNAAPEDAPNLGCREGLDGAGRPMNISKMTGVGLPNDPVFWAKRNAANFWKKVQTSDDCWIWMGSRNTKGYGLFAVRDLTGKRFTRTVRAHRYAYELLIGPIPEGKVLDHIECDNPSCVNPGHLEPTTSAQNTRRARIKAREGI